MRLVAAAIEVLIDHDAEGWTFTFGSAGVVTQLRVDYQLSLLLDGGGIIVVESDFELVVEDRLVRVPVGRVPPEVAPALELLGEQVATCRLMESGELVVRFAAGPELRVGAGQQYDSWQVILGSGEQWVSEAGGRIAHFPARR